MTSDHALHKMVITYGGWYQRTTLHLSEVYAFLALGRSHLPLSAAKLKFYFEALNLCSVTRESGYLEFVHAKTLDGIDIRYYEDGLYALEINTTDIDSAQKQLKDYCDQVFEPAISYIFSLGAPTPKVLADIKISHPLVIFTSKSSSGELVDPDRVYSQIDYDSLSVSKTPELIIINSKKSTPEIRALIDMQIFFREFKDQLERYLNIHRTIWEEISEIKERKLIKGKEIELLRSKLDSYQKTISLISSRINQMSVYFSTRSSIAQKLKIEDDLYQLFKYKFETLADTHNYIKEIWKMTDNYINTAIQVINEVRSKSAADNIQSLTLITTVGVLSGIIGYLSKNEFPTITPIGIVYYLVLLLITFLINLIIRGYYKNKDFKIHFNPGSKV